MSCVSRLPRERHTPRPGIPGILAPIKLCLLDRMYKDKRSVPKLGILTTIALA